MYRSLEGLDVSIDGVDIQLCLNSLDNFAKRIIISFVKLVTEEKKCLSLLWTPKINKNALSSVESRVLGVKQPGLLYPGCYTTFLFGIQNECYMS